MSPVWSPGAGSVGSVVAPGAPTGSELASDAEGVDGAVVPESPGCVADGAADPAGDVAVPPDCGGAVLCVVVSELVGVAAPFDAVHPVRARADVIPRVMAQLRAVLCVMAPAWTRAMLFAIVNNRV